jgi:hypothetical protein
MFENKTPINVNETTNTTNVSTQNKNGFSFIKTKPAEKPKSDLEIMFSNLSVVTNVTPQQTEIIDLTKSKNIFTKLIVLI